MRLRFWQQRNEPSGRAVQEEWLKWGELSGYSPRTLAGYRRITNILIERWPDLKFSQLTDEHILGVIEDAPPGSRVGRRAAFASLFGWAARRRYIERDPMRLIETFKQPPQPPIQLFTDAEVKILCALPEPDGTLMALLFGSGIRKAEARHLTVRRIDFENHELHIVEGAKGGSAGVIPLEHKLIGRLAEMVLLEGLNPEDHLFYCHRGGSPQRHRDRPIADGAFANWYSRCIATAGVTYLKPHTTRHQYATEWRRRGLAIDSVQFLLRHKDLKTTRKVYVHTKAYDVRREMEALT